ncbi:MAG: choice-of-anchor U domain-containing protein [Candidatus Nanopelagicales bacterium]
MLDVFWRPSSYRSLKSVLSVLAAVALMLGLSAGRAAAADVPAQITGTIRDTAGTLLPGATVTAYLAGTTTVAAATTSDTTGVYSLTVVAGTYDLRVVGPAGSGLGATSKDRALGSGATTIDWVIGTATVLVSGRVLVGGVPVGARVQITCAGSNSQTQVYAGADGTYEVPVVADPSCGLYVTYSGSDFEPSYSAWATVDASSDVVLPDIDIPVGVVQVTVLDADGSPASGAQVSVSPTSNAQFPVEFAPGFTGSVGASGSYSYTDGNGAVSLKVVGNTAQYQVSVTKPGSPSIFAHIDATPPTTTATLYAVGSGVWIPGTPAQAADGDNVSPLVEAQVPSLGASGQTGDGNGDGVPDALQPNVTSVPVLGGDPGTQSYVTVAAPTGTDLTNVYTIDPHDTTKVATPPPAGVGLPEGLTNFIATGLTAGASRTISIYTATTAGVTGYAKYNATAGTWSLLPSTRVAIFADHVDITLTDGGIGDDDGVANGSIVDPGGLAVITDGVPPTVTIRGVSDGAKYVLGAVPVVSCGASDSGSGLAGSCSVTVSGGNANHVGSFTATATAVDKAGNRTTVTTRFKVVYLWKGFVDPINDPVAQPRSKTSVFKAGSTVSAQFQVLNAKGKVVAPVSAPLWVAPTRGAATSANVNETVSNAKPDTGSAYRTAGSSWRYSWGTARIGSGFLWRIGVTLDDGETHYVVVGLR